MELHQFQSTAVDSRLHNATEKYWLLASPTGTGKTYMGLGLLGKLEAACLVTPRVEIIADMLRKMGYSPHSLDHAVALGQTKHIYTPIRLRNMMLAGAELLYKHAIYDEAHHDEADTYKQLDALFDTDMVYTGLTATPYRGTPKSTSKFRDRWGDPHWAITYPDAVQQGYLALPRCETWGLVDDDVLELSSTGEFVLSTLCAEVSNTLEHAFIRAKEAGFFGKNGKPSRPTIIGVPSSSLFPQMRDEAGCLGLQLGYVDQSTTYEQRQRLFRRAVNSEIALCHINVISEGVDMPIRQYLDLAPVMSPVAFMQRFGRCTRPLHSATEEAPRYVCTNHNLVRHGYLFDGLLPPSVFIEAQKAFSKPAERTAKARAFGIQSLGKIKPATVALCNGLRVSVYAITQMVDNRKHSYLAILHPSYAAPLFFRRQDLHGDAAIEYGKWSIESDPPTDFAGFKSLPSGSLSEKQVNWWNRSAKSVGLDPTQELTPKVFALLPALKDIGASLA